MKIEITTGYMCQKSTDYSKFERELIPSLQRALQEGKSVTVTFAREVEAIHCQKWALGYGKYRNDQASLKRKRSARLCIANRTRDGKRLLLRPERF